MTTNLLPTHKPTTFGRAFATSALKGAVAFAFVGVLLLVGMLSSMNPGSSAPARPDMAHSPNALFAAHEGECWSGSQPAKAKVPSHVIVQRADGSAAYLGRNATGAALDSMFGDAPAPSFTVLAFCR